jgi:hypothetical protein
MNRRVPAARWVATLTVVAVLFVLTALAVRMKLGDDPAVGAVSASAESTASQGSSDDSGAAMQDLFDDGSHADPGSSSQSAVPSAPSTSRAS